MTVSRQYSSLLSDLSLQMSPEIPNVEHMVFDLMHCSPSLHLTKPFGQVVTENERKMNVSIRRFNSVNHIWGKYSLLDNLFFHVVP